MEIKTDSVQKIRLTKTNEKSPANAGLFDLLPLWGYDFEMNWKPWRYSTTLRE
jgi:hypothetical protein